MYHVLVGAALLFATPAIAATAADQAMLWAPCGDNKVSGFSTFMVGPKAAKALTPATAPSDGIARCTQLLAELDQAGSPWQRKVSALRARARFAIANNEPVPALADLAAISAIEVRDPVYDRSFGVSLLMLRALALVQQGRLPEAITAAEAAARQRPWSSRLQSFALLIAGLDTEVTPAELARMDQYLRLNPSARARRADLRAASGDWSGALADLKLLKPPKAPPDSYVTIANVDIGKSPDQPIDLAMDRRLKTALAAAMSGDSALARAEMAETKALLTQVKIDGPDPEGAIGLVDRWGRLVEAAIALRGGDWRTAAAELSMVERIPASAPVVALLTAASAAVPPADRTGMLQNPAAIEADLAGRRLSRFRQRQSIDALLSELPDHELAASRNRYGSKVLFLRASGFKDTPRADLMGTTINYFGDKSTPMAVEEMALLRASELALQRGLPGLLVTARSDYRHTSTPTMYGAAVGPTTTAGFSSELGVAYSYLEAVPAEVRDSADRIIDAQQVRAALAPIYLTPAD